MHELVIVVFYFYMVPIGHSVSTSISHMVRNGHSVILFPNWLLSNITYGTKWLWCKIHMVRNGFWLWYEIAILWYEMVNYGTKWLWCKIHMVRNCNFVVRNGKLWYEMVMVRNGFWLWYEIAMLWYEIVNYGTKWQWYEMVMVRNDLLRYRHIGCFLKI